LPLAGRGRFAARGSSPQRSRRNRAEHADSLARVPDRLQCHWIAEPVHCVRVRSVAGRSWRLAFRQDRTPLAIAAAPVIADGCGSGHSPRSGPETAEPARETRRARVREPSPLPLARGATLPSRRPACREQRRLNAIASHAEVNSSPLRWRGTAAPA
jgi:hypothetical protein